MRFIQITLGKKLSLTENNAKKSMVKRYDNKVGSLNHKVVSRDKKRLTETVKLIAPIIKLLVGTMQVLARQ